MNGQIDDILYKAASVWRELTDYSYVFTYGRKTKLSTVNLVFSAKDFFHLAGFQYLKDLSIPKFYNKRILEKILDNTITYTQISKNPNFDILVRPRLDALIHIRDIIEQDFKFFSFMADKYPFTTTMKADFVISSHLDKTRFVFIIKTKSDAAECDYLCCSAFSQGTRNYESNQRSLTILKKERIHLASKTVEVLYNRLPPAQ